MFSSRKFPYLKKPSMLRFTTTLAVVQALRIRGSVAAAMRAPRKKSSADVAKSSSANGGFQAP